MQVNETAEQTNGNRESLAIHNFDNAADVPMVRMPCEKRGMNTYMEERGSRKEEEGGKRRERKETEQMNQRWTHSLGMPQVKEEDQGTKAAPKHANGLQDVEDGGGRWMVSRKSLSQRTRGDYARSQRDTTQEVRVYMTWRWDEYDDETKEKRKECDGHTQTE